MRQSTRIRCNNTLIFCRILTTAMGLTKQPDNMQPKQMPALITFGTLYFQIEKIFYFLICLLFHILMLRKFFAWFKAECNQICAWWRTVFWGCSWRWSMLSVSVNFSNRSEIGKKYEFWFNSVFLYSKLTFRCGFVRQIYDEILQNPNDEQSQISMRAIEQMTKLYANFAKYG